MTNSCRKIFVWFLLTNIVGNVYTGKRLNFGETESSIKEYDSVFINGKQEHLIEWSTRVSENEIESDLDLKIIFTQLKCNCAYWINTSLESIRVSIEPCVEKVKECPSDNKSVIDDLVSSNQNIKLALTKLVTISDRYPILKLNESHFLTTLLSACLYIEGLESTRKPEDQNDTNDSQKTHEVLRNINRMLLQIMNLFGQFAVEYCYPSRDSRTYENDRQNANGRFNNVLTSIGLPTSSESVIDKDSLMLAKCMQKNDPAVDETRLDSLLCIEYVRTAKVSRKDLDKGISTISDLFHVLKDSYDIGSVYEFTLAVYQVVVKLIYLKTVDEWTSLDLTRCKEIIEKLKSMYCPVELIDHFQIILEMKRYNKISGFGDIARSYFTKKLDSVQNVSFDIASDDSKWVRMSLSDLTDSLLDGQFKYIWWALNLLHKKCAKKSNMTYDMSLKQFQENVVSFSKLDKKLTCVTLTDVSKYLSTIQSSSEKVSDGLFEKLSSAQWTAINTELYDVYLAAKIQLKFFKNSKSKNEETLKRKVNSIRNMMDNFAIQNCKDINVQNFVYRNAFIIENENQLSHAPKTENGHRHSFHGMMRDVTKIILSDSSKYDDELAILTGENRIKSSGSLGTNIYFNWHGEIKSIKDIETDILENMLNIQDLVEYQTLFSQWLYYVFYKMWIVVFELKCQNQNNNVSKYDVAINHLIKFFKEFFLADSFEVYAHHYSLKVIVYTFLGHQLDYVVGNKMIELVKMGLMKQMTGLLGVVKDDSENVAANVKNLLSINKLNWNLILRDTNVNLNPLLNDVLRFVNEVKGNFQYLFFRSTLNFTYGCYV